MVSLTELDHDVLHLGPLTRIPDIPPIVVLISGLLSGVPPTKASSLPSTNALLFPVMNFRTHRYITVDAQLIGLPSGEFSTNIV